MKRRPEPDSRATTGCGCGDYCCERFSDLFDQCKRNIRHEDDLKRERERKREREKEWGIGLDWIGLDWIGLVR